jgi:flagellar hook-associated protein 3 FlgL
MITRITQNTMTRRLLGDLNNVANQLDRSQRELSTGKKILQPSDDPIGTQRAVASRAQIAATKQYQDNVSLAQGWLETTDGALSSVNDLILKARDLTVQAANDSIGQQGREAIANQIDQIVSAVKTAGNTSFGGVYIFSGTQVNTPPYDTTTVPPVDTYQGDTGAAAREIGPGVSVQINTLVDQGPNPLIGSGQTPGDTGLLRTLRDLADHLRGGTPADAQALQTTDLKALDANHTQLTQSQAMVGATLNRLSSASTRLDASQAAATKILSDTEDVDYAQAMLDLSSQQTVYQAALHTGANIIQPSLLDFLR